MGERINFTPEQEPERQDSFFRRLGRKLLSAAEEAYKYGGPNALAHGMYYHPGLTEEIQKEEEQEIKDGRED